MPAPSKSLIGLFVCFVLLSGCQRHSVAQQNSAATGVSVSLSPDVVKKPVTGRLLVLFSKQNPSPMKGPNWFAPEEFVGVDMTAWKPGDTFVLSREANAYPQPLSRMSPGTYYVQAVLRRNPDFAHHKDGVGNLYSKPQRIRIGRGGPNQFNLQLTDVVRSRRIRPTPTAKVFSHRSDLLSAFHGRDVVDRALVFLPDGYESNPKKSYPVYYEITGFGATIEDMRKQHQSSKVASRGVEFIHVILTGQCEWGHHVYANSQTNGPRGDALVKEMIPAIESQFRTVAKPYARMLGGHSSGGWSSLWLQTQYPKFFGGVWSTSPDPVDFRDWQGTNLYEDSPNIFRTPDGQRKPLAVANGRTIIWYAGFSKMDDVLERGGQLRSFEATFSPRGGDGLPVKCWNRNTGDIDPTIVEHWKQYDISAYLGVNWPTVKDDLAGKIHVFTGDQDTFLLTEAVRLLKQRLQGLGSDAQIEILPGCDHFNLFKSGLQERIYEEMAKKFNQAANADGSTSR